MLLIDGECYGVLWFKGRYKRCGYVLYERENLAGIPQILLSHPVYRDTRILKKLPYRIDPELLKKGEPTVIGNKDLPRIEFFYKYL